MSSSEREVNATKTMETPPSSPPAQFAKPHGDHHSMPSLTETITISLSQSPEAAAKPHATASVVGTPSTPVSFDEAYATALCEDTADGDDADRGGDLPQIFSTPGRSGASGVPPGPRPLGGYHGYGAPPSVGGHHLTSDLTPVISNSGSYVDVPSQGGAKPGMPGLNEASSGAQRGRGAPLFRSTSGPAASGPGEVPRGLRQRSFPPPRAGLPPVAGGAGPPPPPSADPSNPSVASILRMHSGGTSSDASSLRGERLGISPLPSFTPRDASEGPAEGLGLGGRLGEKLSMPSYDSMCSDESSADASNESGGRAQGRGKGASIFQDERKFQPTALGAPIELRPDRKFFSFQGASQYRRSIDEEGGGAEVAAAPRLETIVSPPRRPPLASSSKEGQPRPPATSCDQKQYQPLLRAQHGVTEMADAEDLQAIFKAPRRQLPNVVSPHTPASFAPSILDLQQQQQQQQLGGDLRVAYPVDDRQWSIPSIRLANHVGGTPSSQVPFDLDDSLQSYSIYTYDDDDDGASLDESCYSFLADDDDTASLSSRGSLDANVRKRRIGLHQTHLRRMASLGEQVVGARAVAPASSAPPDLVRPDSLAEKVQDITIDSDPVGEASPFIFPPPMPRRAYTFDLEAPPVLNVEAVVASADDDVVDYLPRSQGGGGRRRERRRRHRSRRREGAAAQWLAELQSKSITGGPGGEGTNVLIAEAASSRFLTGHGIAAVGAMGFSGSGGSLPVVAGAFGGGMQRDAPPSYGGPLTSSEDIVKALGMPHPLCRSTTIEAGPFVNRIHRSVDVSNNSIALTSSGSGD